MEHNYSFSYKNIKLRPLINEDIEYLREWRNCPENTKYLKKIGYITADQQQKWYEAYLQNNDEITFAIEETSSLNRIVGSLSLYNFQGTQAKLGKILVGSKHAHGKKVGFHAVMAALEVGFNVIGVKCIILEVYEDNLPARNIYNKAGFKIVDKHKSDDDKIEFLMCVTNQQYEEAKRQEL